MKITKLPLEKLNQNWLKFYRPSLKKDSRSEQTSLSIAHFVKNDSCSRLFLEK